MGDTGFFRAEAEVGAGVAAAGFEGPAVAVEVEDDEPLPAPTGVAGAPDACVSAASLSAPAFSPAACSHTA